jgi:hypothetical protein
MKSQAGGEAQSGEERLFSVSPLRVALFDVFFAC